MVGSYGPKKGGHPKEAGRWVIRGRAYTLFEGLEVRVPSWGYQRGRGRQAPAAGGQNGGG